ncbi:MAG: methyltransferase domain-containing protein [Elusimicrobia bacterium]|nr:methyltransferase domain-containing protein [Elusimicrobiota bacterium]
MTEFDPHAFTASSRQTWSDAAPRYDKLSAALFGPLTEEFIAWAGIRKGWRVLDVATGPGLASRAAARRAGETGSVLATDLAPGMIELAAARAPEKRAAPIEWRVMDSQALEVPPASFDAVICQLGLMLFALPDAALAGMARAAKPTAPVACLVQGRRSHMLFTALVMDAIVSRAPHMRAPKGAPTLFAFGPDGVLEEHFSRAGLHEIVTKRLTGAFRFKTPEEYWTTMVEGSGRTRAMLDELAPETLAKVRADVLRRAGKRKRGSFIEIPYEFAMARGHAPRPR